MCVAAIALLSSAVIMGRIIAATSAAGGSANPFSGLWLHTLNAKPDSTVTFEEVAWPLLGPQLTVLTLVCLPSTARDVVHQRDQPPRDLSGGLAAALLGEAGVAGQVDEADGWWLRHSLLETRALKCLLDVVDGVLGPDMLATAAVDHQEHSLQQLDDPVADLGAELNQLTLV